MTVDDLSAPLGQHRRPQRWRGFPIALSYAAVGLLALFPAVFVLWAIVGDDQFGGEPKIAVPIDLRTAPAANKPEASTGSQVVADSQIPGRDDALAPKSPPANQGAAATKTVTIIDGKTGAR